MSTYQNDHPAQPDPDPAANPDPTPNPDPNPDVASPENPAKDVDDWVTGDEPATGPQLSYLQTLARETGEEVPSNLTKAEASKRIDRLQQASPRTHPDGPGDANAPGSP